MLKCIIGYTIVVIAHIHMGIEWQHENIKNTLQRQISVDACQLFLMFFTFEHAIVVLL